MKRLLLSVSIIALSIFGANAQNQEWVVGNDLTNFPVVAGYTATTTVKGLTITPGPETVVNMGQIEANAKSFGDIAYPNRFKFNGAGYTGASDANTTPSVNMPTQRYLSFSTSGKCTIKLQGVSGSSSSSRKVFVTDGTNLIGSFDFPASTEISESSVEYNGAATTLYLYCNASVNLYNIKVTSSGNPAAIEPIANEGKVISNTEYYTILGAKVNSSTLGIIIERVTYTDGTVSSHKVFKSNR